MMHIILKRIYGHILVLHKSGVNIHLISLYPEISIQPQSPRNRTVNCAICATQNIHFRVGIALRACKLIQISERSLLYIGAEAETIVNDEGNQIRDRSAMRATRDFREFSEHLFIIQTFMWYYENECGSMPH